jgi:hypothetical protein
MDLRVAAIMVGLAAVAATPTLAQAIDIRNPRAGATHIAALPNAASASVERTATAPRHRAVKTVRKRTHVAALPSAASASVERTATAARHRAGKMVRKRKGTEAALATADGVPLAAPPSFSADAVGWRLIEDPPSGARLGLPEKLVPHAVASRTGSRWSSAQGQIQVETFRLSEAALPALFEQEKKASRRQIVSSELKADSFVIAGTQGLKNFLVRAQARGAEVRGIIILYDQATEGTMDRVAAAMASSFAGFPDPNAGPPPGLKRAVEYGTAIVVSSDGDLIAPAHLTDGCRAITVPPLGHAERVAVDMANDLALIRLYGARNLIAVPLGGNGGNGGELTLFGVADPLAQAGAGAATGTAAHVTAQGIEPAPKLGFAGAAALDPAGSFAGMVDFKPPVVAGAGSASQAATLVPAEAIRAFLNAQGVAPGAALPEAAAIEQSVVRVICVRQ